MAILMLCDCGSDTHVETEVPCGGIRCEGCGRELRLPDAEGPTLPRRRRRGLRAAVLVAGCVSAALVLAFGMKVGADYLETSRKAHCHSQLKRIALAFWEWSEDHGHFPGPAINDPSGRPLLSWRVALLPSLGYRSLYDEFHLDEPWDSPHNRTLIDRMPAVFACPAASAGRGQTGYLVIVGPQAMFEVDHEVELEEITDGTSNTILVVESPKAVPWTSPEDLVYVPEDINAATVAPLPTFGSGHAGGYHVAFVDGTIRFVRYTITETLRRAVITRDGGEVASGEN